MTVERLAENIDAMLRHLPAGSLAQQLVSILRDHPPERWRAELEKFLQARVAGEMDRAQKASNTAD